MISRFIDEKIFAFVEIGQHTATDNIEGLDDKKTEEDVHHVTVKMLRQNKPNDLFQAVINNAEILSFNEVVPSMNDIFISVVENKTTLNTQSAFTE